MVHEYPFSIVEDDVWMWGFQYENSNFHKVTHKTIRSDCVALFEREKKVLKKILESAVKISLTTDMWKSSHQVVEYMVITGHFIDSEWNLQKRVLSFVKVPAARRGIDVADSIYKCLKTWWIENKVFSVSVDNASYNDSCLRCLKDDLSLTSKLILDGSLFHVRYCAHILNFLVQDGLSKIKDIIFNIRESVKYINHNDGRLKAFCDVVEQKGLKERKLVIDCPTRWNSTFNMLLTALNFKIAFAAYKEREPHYDYAPLPEEWNKVEKVCKLLEVFNRATHVISGSEYPTANLYLSKVWKVKEILVKAGEDEDLFMREMAGPMKIKFDKYWGECNMLMAIASVLDPRCKFHMVRICFPKIYKSKAVADENIMKVRCSLEELYDEYVALSLAESSSSVVNLDSNNSSSSQVNVVAFKTGFDEIMSIIQESEAISPIKSELQDYLDEGIYIPKSASFCALDWWRNNSMKYKILSKMVADILAIPISIVASESTFSAGGRVIDEHRSKLNQESVEALICGGDWFRQKYNVKKKSKYEGSTQPVKGRTTLIKGTSYHSYHDDKISEDRKSGDEFCIADGDFPANYDHMAYMRSILKDPTVLDKPNETITAEHLKRNPRLLNWIISRIIRPRSGGYSRIERNEIILMYLLENRTRVHWPHFLANKFYEVKNKTTALCYGSIIHKIVNHFT
ncbi:zinc finger BED domain-containing protein RICESLEEPER 2-like [Vicia villosa]|uniref:zinc finger BED domain-containing protein RICESLEEPER 2-like n=1 Tax=Vicia villosa TaxID=3911 RepID=UPI00273B733C|nr:zinc finger BED domain-containing protein RICESLEEPER 2-like [Vicia villosa]